MKLVVSFVLTFSTVFGTISAHADSAAKATEPQVVLPSELKPALDGQEIRMTFKVADTQLIGGYREGEFPSVLIHQVGRKNEHLNIYVKGELADILHRLAYVSPDDNLIGRTITASGKITAHTKFPPGEDQTPLYELELREWKKFQIVPKR